MPAPQDCPLALPGGNASHLGLLVPRHSRKMQDSRLHRILKSGKDRIPEPSLLRPAWAQACTPASSVAQTCTLALPWLGCVHWHCCGSAWVCTLVGTSSQLCPPASPWLRPAHQHRLGSGLHIGIASAQACTPARALAWMCTPASPWLG